MKHTIGVLMENKPGILSRISTLLARRAFNIDSITAGTTFNPEVTRMTVVVDGDEYVAGSAAGEMTKLEDVIEIEHMLPEDSTSREIMLIKIRAGEKEKAELLDLAKVLGFAIVGSTETTLILEHTDTPEQVDALVSRLSAYEVLDIARTGAIALKTGE